MCKYLCAVQLLFLRWYFKCEVTISNNYKWPRVLSATAHLHCIMAIYGWHLIYKFCTNTTNPNEHSLHDMNVDWRWLYPCVIAFRSITFVFYIVIILRVLHRLMIYVIIVTYMDKELNIYVWLSNLGKKKFVLL